MNPERQHRAKSPRALRAGAIAVLALIAACLSTPARAVTDTELKVKAAFLFNFAKFVSWPYRKFASPGSPIELCVLEDDPIGPVLEDTVRGKLIESRALAVRRSKTPADWSRCHIAFIGAVPSASAGDNSSFSRTPAATNSAPVADAFLDLTDHSVLTVHESGRALSGGVVRFYVEERRMRFEINVAAAEREALQLSAKLMSVATVVRE